MLQIVQVTAQYSNAVLVAVLPFVNDFVKKMELPLPTPIEAHPFEFKCSTRLDDGLGIGGAFVWPNGYGCFFDGGIIQFFYSSRSYKRLQDPRRIPEFYGDLKMTEKEAVEMCIETLNKLGHSTTNYNANNVHVTGPLTVQGHTVPFYRVAWNEVFRKRDMTAVEFEIDGHNRKIAEMSLISRNFYRAQPVVMVKPTITPFYKTEVKEEPIKNPLTEAQSNAFFKAVLPECSDFAKRLNLPIPNLNAPGAIKSFRCGLNEGFAGTILTTNGCKITFFRGYAMSFWAPDRFFSYDWMGNGGKYEDFVGPITMSVDQVAESCRNEIRKLGYPKDKVPIEGRPSYKGGPADGETTELTRYWLQWSGENPGKTNSTWQIDVEYDSKTKTLKFLQILNPELRRDFP